jgi:hypothetical protein
MTEEDLGHGGEGVCLRHGVETCCTGSEIWPETPDYYERSVPSCGEPRICAAAVCVSDCRQDAPNTVHPRLKCCEDERWHFVMSGSQFIPESSLFGLGLPDQLSPPCGGDPHPSLGALHFNGSGYLDLPTRTRSKTPSFELWFRTTAPTGPLLSSTSTAYTLYLSDGRVCFYPSIDAEEVCSEEAGVNDGEWHHAAMSSGAVPASDDRDLAYGGIYLDGKLAHRADIAVLGEMSGFTAGRGRIGESSELAYFTGDLDEIRVWGESRGSYQVLDYTRTRLTDEETLPRFIGYWPLEESGSAATTPNMALAEKATDICGEGIGGEGGASAVPDGALVDFDFTSSPWLDQGAF